jgi:hypothetical protein
MRAWKWLLPIVAFIWLCVHGVVAADMQVARLGALSVGIVRASVNDGGQFQREALFFPEYISPRDLKIEGDFVGASQNRVSDFDFVIVVARELKIPECDLAFTVPASGNGFDDHFPPFGLEPRQNSGMRGQTSHVIQRHCARDTDAACRGLAGILDLEGSGDGILGPTKARRAAVQIGPDLRLADTLRFLSLVQRSCDEIQTHSPEQGLKSAHDVHPEGGFSHAHLGVQIIIGALLIALGSKGVMDADLAIQRGEPGARRKGNLSVLLFLFGSLIAVSLTLYLSLQLQTPA